jgi:hypothetical protein
MADLEEGLGVVHLSNGRTGSDAVFKSAEYALKALQAALHGRVIPPLPPIADPSHVPNAADYVGTYRAGDRVLRVNAQNEKLSLDFGGEPALLERRTDDSFFVRRPRFDLFLLEFGRDGGKVVEAFHGPDWYVTDRYAGPRHFDYPKEWEAYTGHYRTRSPELSNFRVMLRKGTLVMMSPSGDVEPLRPLGTGLFHIGDDQFSPETLRFDSVLEGRALRATYSGCPCYRTFHT